MASATSHPPKEKSSPKVRQSAKPTAEFEMVSPAKAALWLKSNDINRNVNDENFAMLVREMKNEKFQTTGESIIFNKDGQLMDGQHRLLAIIKSGIPQLMLVVHNIDNEAFSKINCGRVRQSSDVLGIEMKKQGYAGSPTKISSIIKFVINLKAEHYDQAARNYSKGARKVTNTDVLEFWRLHKDAVADSFPYGYNRYNKLVSGTVLAGLHYILKKKDYPAASIFCERISDGLNIATDSPMYAIRQKFAEDAKNRLKMSSYEKLALLLKAWNIFRKGKKCSTIRWASKEGFPKPI